MSERVQAKQIIVAYELEPRPAQRSSRNTSMTLITATAVLQGKAGRSRFIVGDMLCQRYDEIRAIGKLCIWSG